MSWWPFGKKAEPALEPVVAPTAVSPLKPPKIRKVKSDTDHAVGKGSMSITGRFDSKGDSIRFESAYLLGDSFTAHAKYGITDEKLLGVGLETRFEFLGRANTVDMVYAPASDVGTMKLAVKQGAAKLSGSFSFDGLRARRVLSLPAAQYELNAKLNDVESIKLGFNKKSRAAKVKWMRKLDPRNRLDFELHYPGANANKEKFAVVSLNHAVSKRHAVTYSTNYGTKKHLLEWVYKTQAGPWTVACDLAFDKPRGNWNVKRRFDF